MKTDIDLRRDVLAELGWEPRLTEKGIDVAVSEGVVTLRGRVPSYTEKHAALLAAERVQGVRAVDLEIEVALPPRHERADATLAHAVASALECDAFVPFGKVTVHVERGRVTLGGRVDYEFQRAEAERAVRHLHGLRDLTNDITVAMRPASAEMLKSEVCTALKRHTEIDASHVAVEATEHTVTLRGRVPSWADRCGAERAAWSAPGVTFVDDRIAIIRSRVPGAPRIISAALPPARIAPV